MADNKSIFLPVGACPFCASNEVIPTLFECPIPVGRSKKTVSGLQQSECQACGEVFVSGSQHDYNAGLFEAAGREKQAFVTQGLIRKFRERFGLSQRTASKLFGAGAAAVGKWEAGQLPSGPAALLIQTAIHVPGAAQFLAGLANVTVTESIDGLQWRSSKAPITGAQRKYTSLLVVAKDRGVNLSDPDSDYTIEDLYGVAA
jgi:putative zinc finger/helix-turn-helix YgiT family protein